MNYRIINYVGRTNETNHKNHPTFHWTIYKTKLLIYWIWI